MYEFPKITGTDVSNAAHLDALKVQTGVLPATGLNVSDNPAPEIDNASALQTLLDAYAGKRLVLPPGKIQIKSVVNVKAGTHLIGANGYRTIIIYKPTGVAQQKMITCESDVTLEMLDIRQEGYQLANTTSGLMIYAHQKSGIALKSLKVTGPTIYAGGLHGTQTAVNNNPVGPIYFSECTNCMLEEIDVRGSNHTFNIELLSCSFFRVREIKSYDGGLDGIKLQGAEDSDFTNMRLWQNGQALKQGVGANGGGVDGHGERLLFHNIVCYENESVGFQLKPSNGSEYNKCRDVHVDGLTCYSNINGVGLVFEVTTGEDAVFCNIQFENVTCHSNTSAGFAVSAANVDYEIHGVTVNNMTCRDNGTGISFNNGNVSGFQFNNINLWGNGRGGSPSVRYNLILRGRNHSFTNLFMLGVDPVSEGIPREGAFPDGAGGWSRETPVCTGMFIDIATPATNDNHGIGVLHMTNVKSLYHHAGQNVLIHDNAVAKTLDEINASGTRVVLRNFWPRVAQSYPLDPLEAIEKTTSARLPNLATTTKLAISDGGASTVPVLSANYIGGTSGTRSGRFLWTVPVDYIAGSPITVRAVAACENTVCSTSCTLAVSVKRKTPGGSYQSSSNLCTTGAQSINQTSPVTVNYTVTPTTIIPLDMLVIELDVAYNDTGGVNESPVIYAVDVIC